jgi:hypothetical protein
MSQPMAFLLATVAGIGALLVLAASGLAHTRNHKKGDPR